MPARSYAISLPGTQGGHADSEVLIVRPTGDTDAQGRPLYADPAHRILVAITGRTAYVVSGSDQGPLAAFPRTDGR